MKLKIAKYKTIENLELSIPSQIKGGNGLGKSTILEAISFVLTGKDLNGSEFKQVYDNRVDLHDAFADVSYFDNYGNEFRRIVKPIFQTNRAGIEEIKIKRSTECRKNGIAVNDFSDEFVDFYKFGTDYFFNQKEDLQRSIFIDILKSKLPDYDVNSASLKLKELKKSQKIEVDLVKGLQDANKNTKDVPVPVIDIYLERLNGEFLALQNSSNPDAIVEINKKNNDAMSLFLRQKRELSEKVSEIEISIEKVKSSIQLETEKLEKCKSAKFMPKETESTEKLMIDVSFHGDKLAKLEYFESIENYAAKYFSKNPVLVENQNKIVGIGKREFVLSFEPKSNCPLTNEFCEIAKGKSAEAEAILFKNNKEAEISTLKSQNRAILEKEMSDVNREYNAVKSDLQELERKLNNVIEANKNVDADNEFLKRDFDVQNRQLQKEYEEKIHKLRVELEDAKVALESKKFELSKLIEPTPEKLPEQLEISDELKQAHADYKIIEMEIWKAKGVNENNIELITSRSAEIKSKQLNLMKILEQISKLTAEISDYFSKLKGVVKSEFAGDIDIDVELLEFVMSKDEYKDCFKITANGKVFPYECNGALQNNVKLQILANLQRLKGYKGVTILDNCEANTTDPINTCGLNCVLSYATNDKQLIIS